MLRVSDSHSLWSTLDSRQTTPFPLYPEILREDCLSLSSHTPLAGRLALSWNLALVNVAHSIPSMQTSRYAKVQRDNLGKCQSSVSAPLFYRSDHKKELWVSQALIFSWGGREGREKCLSVCLCPSWASLTLLLMPFTFASLRRHWCRAEPVMLLLTHNIYKSQV